MQALTFQIDPVALPDDEATLGAMVLRWTAWWANWPHAVRLFCDLLPQRYPARLAQLNRAVASLQPDRQGGRNVLQPPSWRRRWLIAQRTHLDDLHADGQGMRLQHYLVTWVPDDMDAAAVQATIARGLLVPLVPTTLPRFWRHQPGEHIQHLVPEHPGDPYMTVLMAHTIKGTWTPLSLDALLHLDVRLTLVLDVQTPPAEGWQGTESKVADLQQALARIAARDPSNQRAHHAHEQVREINAALAREFLHQVGAAIVIQARTPARLRKARQQVVAATRSHVAWVACPWVQHRQLAFFSDTLRTHIHAPLPPAPVRSFGVAHLTPVGVRRQARADGVLLGRDLQTGLQLHHDLLRLKENKHICVLGQPKFGKTTFLSALATRLATEGAQVMLLEPLGKAALVRDMVADGRGCQYTEVAEQCRINLLDPVSDNPAVQYQKVVRGLELALGRLVRQGTKQIVVPRTLDEHERGVLDRAVLHARVYGEGGHRLSGMTSADAPLLPDLVAALGDVVPDNDAEQQARARLAYMIHRTLLGTGQRVYGQRTALRTAIDHDVTLYTTRGVDPALTPLVYDHLFSAAMRYMRQPRSRPLFILIDETYIMTMLESLEAWLIEGIKGGRNYETGIVLADQNIEIFFTEQGTPTAFGAFVLANTGLRVFFRVDGLAGELVERAYRGKMAQQQLEQIRTLAQGEYVALFEDEVVHARLDLLPLEARYLA